MLKIMNYVRKLLHNFEYNLKNYPQTYHMPIIKIKYTACTTVKSCCLVDPQFKEPHIIIANK